MGNCLRLRRGQTSSSSAMVWAADDDDDDWYHPMAEKEVIPEKQGFLDYDPRRSHGALISSSSSSLSNNVQHKEIKIKITKKQLEKLLGEVDMHEMPVDQVLSRLIINAGEDSQNFQHQRSWRPRLQSIPEVD